MSFAEYHAHGWALCRIEPGKKAPLADDWNDASITEQDIADIELIGGGCGIMHALSGTCALDIDNLDAARPYLAERGVDVDALLASPEAVKIISGRAGRAKLLYRMKFPMRTLKPKDSGIELRSATSAGKSVQDVLPPTIHPVTRKPYEWVYGDPMLGHWSNLPPIPANLLAMWRTLASETPVGKNTAPPKADATMATVRKAIYYYINKEHKDVTNYADWIDIGQRLHDQTGGAQEGLELWDEWSATDDSVRDDGQLRYQGMDACELHWRSFTSSPGKSVVGMGHVIAQMPAEVDEFDIEPETDEVESAAAKLKEQAELKKVEAQAALEGRLVYVRNLEKYFDTQRHKVILTEAGLRHQFQPMMPRRSRGRLDPVELLRDSTTKRYVDSVGFHPGEGAIFKTGGDNYANTYRNRLPEPIKPTTVELEKIDWLFSRITDIPYREWLIQFYAHVVQYPGVKIKSAPLIWSEVQGNGKTTLVKVIPALLVGSEYSVDITSNQLEDAFTGYLLGAWHVNLTEFRATSRNQREAVSKKVESWIADTTVTVRPMQIAAYTMPNHFFVTASSNFDDAASIGGADRKWGVHELVSPRFTEEERRWIYDEFLLTARAAGVLRHYFLNTLIVDFSPSAAAPITRARQDMVEASVSSEVEVMRNAFDERSGLFARDVVLVPEVTSFLHKNSASRPSMIRVGRLLAKTPFNGTTQRVRVGASRYHVVVIRNHAKWVGASGKDVMAHIEGMDDDNSVEHEPTDEELLA